MQRFCLLNTGRNQLCYHARFIVDSIKTMYVIQRTLFSWFLNAFGGLKGSINSSFEEA